MEGERVNGSFRLTSNVIQPICASWPELKLTSCLHLGVTNIYKDWILHHVWRHPCKSFSGTVLVLPALRDLGGTSASHQTCPKRQRHWYSNPPPRQLSGHHIYISHWGRLVRRRRLINALRILSHYNGFCASVFSIVTKSLTFRSSVLVRYKMGSRTKCDQMGPRRPAARQLEPLVFRF